MRRNKMSKNYAKKHKNLKIIWPILNFFVILHSNNFSISMFYSWFK